MKGDLIKGRPWLLWIFMGGMAVMLCAPTVVNHSEAEDAYDYAREVRELEYRELLHTNHRIYHPLAKAIYEYSGVDGAFGVLVVFSMVCAVLALWGFNGLLGDVGVSSLSTRCFLVACLAASYGFWRYAHEVEVYALGWLVLVLVLRLLFRVRGWVGGVLLAVAVVFLINIHRGLGPPFMIMALVYLGSERDWRALATGMAVGAMVYLGTEELASRIGAPRIAEVSALQQLAGGVDGEGAIGWVHLENRVGWSSVPRAMVGFGSSVMGGLVVMGFDGLYEFLQYRLFPFRFLTEERWLAERVTEGRRWWWVILALVTTAGFLWFGLRGASWRALWEGRTWRRLVLPIGMVSYAAMITVFEPGNPEMWLLGLPLFWGACGALLPTRVGWRAMVLPALLALTNYVGGLQLLGDYEKDYHWVTARHVLQEAESDDIYLIDARNISQKGYVEYYRDVEVVRVWGKLDDAAPFYDAVAGELKGGRRVFVHESLARRAGGFGMALSEAGLEFVECEDCAGGGRLELLRGS